MRLDSLILHGEMCIVPNIIFDKWINLQSRCDPVVCDITDHHGSFKSMTSYGKKRKKRSAKHSDTKDDDVMVAG